MFNKVDLEKTLEELKVRIQKCKAISILAKQHSVNFENWVQVELCDILSNDDSNTNICVEKQMLGNTDIYFENDNDKNAIEIKIIDIKWEAYKYLHDSVTRDIEKLNCYEKIVGQLNKFLIIVLFSSYKDVTNDELKKIIVRLNWNENDIKKLVFQTIKNESRKGYLLYHIL